jgi:hypothetical protein
MAYARPDLDRRSSELDRFKKDAMRWLGPGVAIAAASAEPPAGTRAPRVTFTIGQGQRPEPFEQILEWLRGHPLVRMIEVEYHST